MTNLMPSIGQFITKEEWPAECSLFSLSAGVKYSSFSGCGASVSTGLKQKFPIIGLGMTRKDPKTGENDKEKVYAQHVD